MKVIVGTIETDPLKPGKETGTIGYQMKNWDHPDSNKYHEYLSISLKGSSM